MKRRTFVAASIGTACALPVKAQEYSDYSKDPRPDVPEGAWTVGGIEGDVFKGKPVVSGPAADAMCILQPLQRLATGYLEFAVDDGSWQRVDGGHAGMLPLSEYVLKFSLPPLPTGRVIRYRVNARAVGWIKVKQFYHGEFKASEPHVGPVHSFRTLDPNAESTTFAVWNDTHENAETLRALDELTSRMKPDFMLWNGDQSNDVHFERNMADQFLTPKGIAIADRWPLAYVRGNHDVRGPAAMSLASFTGTPNNQFYYGFRSGPVAAIVLDTGEDKPDDSPFLSGMAAFQKMQQEQAIWLKEIVKQAWFRSAPHKVLFCHIPIWFHHPRIPNNRFNGAAYCRDLWLPTLIDAGVKLVISGHTHDYLWMPAKKGQPIAQLVGGASSPNFATFIQCAATREALTFKMTKLDGAVVAEAILPA